MSCPTVSVARESNLLLSFKPKSFGMSFEAPDKFCSPSHSTEGWNFNYPTVAYSSRMGLPRPLASPTPSLRDASLRVEPRILKQPGWVQIPALPTAG